MAIEDRNLKLGTRLVANYRKQAHACMVEKTEEGDGVLFVLEDGRKFKSLSSAARAVMGGKAVNGWRFWSVQGRESKARGGGEKPRSAGRDSEEARLPRPEPEGDSGGSEPLVLSGLHEGLRRRRRWATGCLPRRSRWRRAEANGRPSRGGEQVGRRTAPRDEAPSGACLVTTL